MEEENLEAKRLDQYVIKQFPALSRSAATYLVEHGKVQISGKVITKSGHKIHDRDIITVDYDPRQLSEPPEVELPILYEDKSCVVINKPVGVLSHSKGAFNAEATVATWLQGRVKGLSGERAGIVHRLDRATSGVMICAKTPDALKWLQKQFADRKAKKTYVAVVEGMLKEEAAVIDMPIERDPKKPQTFRVGVNGKSAVTAYTVLRAGDGRALLELRPTTGRTHQLRVHLKQLGHPIVGDTLYGGQPADRLFLHAYKLEITLPNRKRETFEAPLPAGFEEEVTS